MLPGLPAGVGRCPLAVPTWFVGWLFVLVLLAVLALLEVVQDGAGEGSGVGVMRSMRAVERSSVDLLLGCGSVRWDSALQGDLSTVDATLRADSALLFGLCLL